MVGNTEDKPQGEQDMWSKYSRLLNSSSPLAIVLISSSILTYIKDATIWHWLAFFVTGISLSVMQYFKEIRIQNAETDISRDLHDNLGPIDEAAQAQIYDGLLSTPLIDDTLPGLNDLERLVRCRINDIAVQSLTASVFQNHHSRDIAEYGADGYLEKKKKIVLNKLGRYHSEYKQFIINRLPEGITFEQAVDSFVCRWVIDEVIPAIREACEKKIAYYKRLAARTYLSKKCRVEIEEWRLKNERYLIALDTLLHRSDVCLRSTAIVTPVPKAAEESLLI